ncbi:MAG TPA: cupin domain-containing protein [Chloroflexota bacterium]|nr:cupin domain-containing protein [Chloroflexota bacterium]
MTQTTPEPQDLAARLRRHVARFADRVPDWEAFEEAKIPGFHRAQHRYVGAGASGKYDDPNAIPPGSFTVSVMLVPPGQGNPPHTHEVEEVFFVLKGQLTCFWCAGDARVEQVLGPWDMVFNPADVAHGYHNATDEDVYVQIMLGRPRPDVPSYVEERYEREKYDHLKRR